MKKSLHVLGGLSLLPALLWLPGADAQSTAPAAPTPAATSNGACDPYQNYQCLDDALGNGFFTRLVNYYKLEWGQSAAPSDPHAPEGRRADFPPQAQTNPPMPFTEWPYGGTTPLGVTRPNSVDSPLMNAISDTSMGAWLAKNNFQIYGWVDVGANLSTSSQKPGGNAPAAYLYTPNTIQLDQAVIYLDRFPDTVQTDHIDWGMRLSAIYGENYRYTTSFGLGSSQLLQHNKVNGFDAPMIYGELYIPQVADGMMLRAGRFISIPDIEAQLAPNNYMYTHSMSYTFDNYTNTGLLASVAASHNLTLQLGVVAGTESTLPHLTETENNPYPNVAGSGPGQPGYNPLYPYSTFKKDPGARPSLSACVRYDSNDGGSDVNVCADGINNGTYGYNNLQWLGFTAYHSFNEHWHISYEAYDLYQRDVPNALNSDVQTIYAKGGSPFSSTFMPYNAPDLAICSNSKVLTCRASSIGSVAYLNYSPDPLNNFSIRPEWYWDEQGQRTGSRRTMWTWASAGSTGSPLRSKCGPRSPITARWTARLLTAMPTPASHRTRTTS